MKKIWITVLMLALVISLAACKADVADIGNSETDIVSSEINEDISDNSDIHDNTSDTSETQDDTVVDDTDKKEFSRDTNNEDKWDKLNPIG